MLWLLEDFFAQTPPLPKDVSHSIFSELSAKGPKQDDHVGKLEVAEGDSEKERAEKVHRKKKARGGHLDIWTSESNCRTEVFVQMRKEENMGAHTPRI